MPPSNLELPAIPVIDAGPAFPRETFVADTAHAHSLMDSATRGVPRAVLKGLDVVSRRWLVKHDNPYLGEIDELSRMLGRPGGHFLSVSYEWGCTVSVGPSADGRSARLARVLDWVTPGLGRHVMAARVAGPAGPFVTMTWPGFNGVLQTMAPGRFSAALNQAPLRRLGGGLFAADWLANKARLWSMPHQPALHLLRHVVETAPDYTSARRLLCETPIASPATYSLAGLAAHQTCVIERTEERAYVIDGAACATNQWRGLDHGGHPRGIDSEGRFASIVTVGAVDFDPAFPWLREPVLNDQTRLAMVADASLGRLVVQGYEAGRPATRALELSMARTPAIAAAEA